jgi:transcriptional regulator with GAF, ATPase, and Fis domain
LTGGSADDEFTEIGYPIATEADQKMKRTPDLIDQFTNLVLGADEPQRLAERTVEIILSLTHGRCAAVFRIDAGRLVLFASRGVDQAALDAAHADWNARAAALASGEMFYAPTASESGAPEARAAVPIRSDDAVVGILYVDSAESHFLDAADCQRLVKFTRILARALAAPAMPAGERPRGWERYLERTSVEDMERERLLLLLERNEWNIARVARLMQVTRRTVYLRLARYGVARERVRKGRPAIAR